MKTVIKNCIDRKVKSGIDRSVAEKECTDQYNELKAEIREKRKKLRENEIILK